MVKRIVTKDKRDIDTGFEITFNVDMLHSILHDVAPVAEQAIGMKLPTSYWEQEARSSAMQCVSELNKLINEAEEIFIEEASLSRWSGNMIDNSVCGISGTMPTIRGAYNVYMDIKVGVNRNEIMNTKNWTSRPNKRPNRTNASPVIYEYHGFRMRPGVDYSVMLDEGTAKIPNAAAWAGFVARAEERFNNL